MVSDGNQQSTECFARESLPLYVIVINGKAQDITIKWLIELLKKDNSGQDAFIIEEIVDEALGNDRSNDIILQIGASRRRLNSAASAIQLKQLTFGRSAAVTFSLNESRLDDDCLSHSEQQKALLHELENVQCHQKDVLFGYPQVKLYPGQSILQVCQRENVICEYFPVHNQFELNELKKKWCLSLDKQQPLDLIRNYFGETIAFYFAFLEFYTLFLLPPAMLGLIQYLFLHDANPILALFNMIWGIIFLKCWKRKSNQLAFRWGTIEDPSLEGPRPTFRAKTMARDPITGELTPIYPIHKTWIKEYGMSIPILLFCLYLSFRVMLFYFEIEDITIKYFESNPNSLGSILVNLPAVAYALIVMLMNHVYRRLATRLNEWENHRTQTSHENHLIIKLVLFEFINNFMSFFYVAFYLKDLSLLKWQVATLLVVNQLVDNVQEVLFPLIAIYRFNKAFEKNTKKDDTPDKIRMIFKEKSMTSYDGTYYDYLELFTQFGYVFLFITVFPLAPVFALVNNLIEIRSDAFKFCFGFKRPHQRSANSINGSWIKSFEVMLLISVITNCALVCTWRSFNILPSPTNASDCHWHLNFALFEHFVLTIILLISYIVPDVPKHVNVALKKQHHDKQKSHYLKVRSLSRIVN